MFGIPIAFVLYLFATISTRPTRAAFGRFPSPARLPSQSLKQATRAGIVASLRRKEERSLAFELPGVKRGPVPSGQVGIPYAVFSGTIYFTNSKVGEFVFDAATVEDCLDACAATAGCISGVYTPDQDFGILLSDVSLGFITNAEYERFDRNKICPSNQANCRTIYRSN